MTGAHTPGPWKARDDGVVVIQRANQHGYQQPIKLISPWRESAWDGDEEAEANANLIAAAPELLEAGKALDQFAWGSCVQTDCEESRAYLQSLIDNLRAAIAKAEGRQS